MELALLQSATADRDPLIKAGGSALPGMSPSAAPALGHSAPLQEKNVCKSHGSPVGDSSERGLIQVGTFGFFWGEGLGPRRSGCVSNSCLSGSQ